MQLLILGTASQLPGKKRNHNGYYLRWLNEGFLFDPGEGTQRQFSFAKVSPAKITRIFISHFHGDHCLGLPGIVHRLNLIQVENPIHLYYPASGEKNIHNLLNAAQSHLRINLEFHPIEEDGIVYETNEYKVEAFALNHSVETFGYRISEFPRMNFDKKKLKSLKLSGPILGELEKKGVVDWKGKKIKRENISTKRDGEIFSYVLDTGVCENINPLIKDAKVALMESTYLSSESQLAKNFKHLSADIAGKYAKDNNVKNLILTHFSERYIDLSKFEDEVKPIFKNVHIARDLELLEY
ncbi:MAG: ribonuclease Z [Candidatus Marinimicrobia bacterium]|nr:ribonuclease Z [Candidatus Neomarinimicrobiota bacterium]